MKNAITIKGILTVEQAGLVQNATLNIMMFTLMFVLHVVWILSQKNLMRLFIILGNGIGRTFAKRNTI